MLTVSLSPTSASSATNDDKLAACDAALYAKVREADLCNLGVKLRDDELTRVTKENADLRDRGSAWYNSAGLWAAVGVIVGAYAGARATR